MRRIAQTIALAATAALAMGAAAPAMAKSRIKDIVTFEGVRPNPLIGQGLVTGLNGTGDNLRNCPMTEQMFRGMSERLGSNTAGGQLNLKNVAYVQVTANLPAFAAAGAPIDVTVSSACDAKNLMGGTLVVTDLRGADGQTYALAQGTVQTGSVSASGASGSSITKGVPTAGRIPGGATVEREVGFQFASMKSLRLTLRNPDFTTAQRIAQAINVQYPASAVADNPTVVTVTPRSGDVMAYVTSIENLEVEPENVARVVIDEVTGTVAINDAVRVSRVAIAQGNLTVSVLEQPAVSQPQPFSRTGTTEVVPQSTISIEEEKGKQLHTVGPTASLDDLVRGLNALGVTPNDLKSILIAIKALGALQADIEVM